MTSRALRCLGGSIALSAALSAAALAQEPPPPVPAPPATADPAAAGSGGEAAACARSFERAQELRDEGKLLAARAELVSCGRDACPEVVHRKCRAWLPDVAARIPSVVVQVTDAAGREVTPARILIDGVATSTAAGAIEIDPGAHAVRVEHEGAGATERLTLAESEKLRAVRLRLEAPVAAPAAAPATGPVAGGPPDRGPRRLSPFVYAGAGLAAAGLVVGSVAGAVTLVRRSEVASECDGPAGCTQDRIDSLLLPAHVSTVAFATAGVGATVAVIAWLVSPRGQPARPRGASVAPVWLGPGAPGVSASIPLR